LRKKLQPAYKENKFYMPSYKYISQFLMETILFFFSFSEMAPIKASVGTVDV